MMNKDISRFISVSRLPVIMGPVLIHAHWPVIMESSFQHSCCVVGWITVPLFFLISGFLYFQGYDGSIDVYIGKLKKRFRSLLIPYLIWNTIAYFVFAYLLGLQDPSHFIQSYWSVPENANAPADGPLWFIQKLIIYTVLAPLFFFIISSRYSKYIVAVAFGLFLFNAPMTDRGLIIGFIFFLGGGYCAYHQNTPPPHTQLHI